MSAEHQIAVSCSPQGDGWECDVTVGVDPGATRHRVTVAAALLETLRPGTGDPEPLVGDSFAFLLEREPREAILRSFDLPVIGRYFPGWESEVRRPPASA
jgi:hypothetical protein